MSYTPMSYYEHKEIVYCFLLTVEMSFYIMYLFDTYEKDIRI